MDEEFKERKRHWWLRVLVFPVAFLIAGILLTWALNRDDTTTLTPTPPVSTSTTPPVSTSTTPPVSTSTEADSANLPDISLLARQHSDPPGDYTQEVHVIGTGAADVRAEVLNPGPKIARAVVMNVEVPPELSVDLTEIYILDSNNPAGARIGAGVTPTKSGFEINLGGFMPDTNAFIVFTVELRDIYALKCGDNTLTLRASFTDRASNLAGASDEVRLIYRDTLNAC